MQISAAGLDPSAERRTKAEMDAPFGAEGDASHGIVDVTGTAALSTGSGGMVI
jgi:hypothetical protein